MLFKQIRAEIRSTDHLISSAHFFLFYFSKKHRFKKKQKTLSALPVIIFHSSLNSEIGSPVSFLFSFSLSLLYTDELKPFVPKLEKSVSGSSPSRDRLLLTVMILLLAALLIS